MAVGENTSGVQVRLRDFGLALCYSGETVEKGARARVGEEREGERTQVESGRFRVEQRYSDLSYGTDSFAAKRKVGSTGRRGRERIL